MDMKTYKAKERLGRLVAYLIATKKPFVISRKKCWEACKKSGGGF